MREPTPNLPTTTTSSGKRKPRVSLAMATAFGLGYLPKAPGTWGSLGGVALALLPHFCEQLIYSYTPIGFYAPIDAGTFTLERMSLHVVLNVLIAAVGIIVASVAGRFWEEKDPQRVVIDEVSGQYLALFLGIILPHGGIVGNRFPSLGPVRFPMLRGVNWKYLLLGFILFRVFDIWKPFPARQAESLRGGLGIMADDWIAGIYAGLGMWIIRVLDFHFGFHLGF
jgi:phosphatidylglycerophosphatase A